MRELPLFSQDSSVESLPAESPDRWTGKERHVLVFNYTAACPLSCDFCCYGCHPKRAEKMPLELAVRLVHEAADHGGFSSIAFTGGEPLLFFDEIVAIADVIAQRGLRFTVATAGHWASTPEEADRIVGTLVDRGMTRINLSSDPSHEKFVPVTNVVNAARAANARDIDTIVTGVFYSAEESLAERVPELTEMPSVLLMQKVVNKVGRAAREEVTQERFGFDLSLASYACYRRKYHDLVVFYDGEAYPCCSTFNRATRGIRIGNAFEDSLAELFNRAERSTMLRTMKREGFARLYEIVSLYDPELFAQLPDPRNAVGACHLCNLLFRKGALTERLQAVFERYSDDAAVEMVDSVISLLGADKAINLISEMLFTP